MARTLTTLVLAIALATAALSLPVLSAPAVAAELDKRGKSDAKEAMRFYKEGNYEDAAKLFLRLSIGYPEMLVFVRNLGACYYYMRRYEPALSNLRDYLHRKTDIADDDRAEVSGWIGEMERLRDQATAPAAAPVAPPVAVPAPVPSPPSSSTPSPPAAPGGAPAVPPPQPAPPAAPPAPAPVPAAPPAAVAPAPPAPAAPAAPAASGELASPPANAYSPQPSYAAPAQYPAPYAQQPQYGAQPPYGEQPQYPQQSGAPPYGAGPYGAPSPYGQPQYPPAQAGYGPGYGAAYGPAGAAPAGVAAPARPQPSSGSGRRAGAWLLGIAGVGALAGGGVLTYLALNRFSQVEKKYDPTKEKDGRSYATGAGICYGVGGAALVAAIVLGATGGSSGQVALAPAVGPGVAGAALAGSF